MTIEYTSGDALAEVLLSERLAHAAVEAANVVTCDGYYEVDIESASASILAILRTDPLHTAALAAGYATVADWVGAKDAEIAEATGLLRVWAERYKAVPEWRLRPTSDDQPFVQSLVATRTFLARAALTKGSTDV